AAGRRPRPVPGKARAAWSGRCRRRPRTTPSRCRRCCARATSPMTTSSRRTTSDPRRRQSQGRAPHRPGDGGDRGGDLRGFHPQRRAGEGGGVMAGKASGTVKLLGVALGAVAFTFALVPLYRIACVEVFGVRLAQGPSEAAARAGTPVSERWITVQFDGGVNS